MTAQQDKQTHGGNLDVQDDLPLFAALHTPMVLKIMRLPDVIARVGLKRASIYRYVSNGRFPKAISLGPRAVGWAEHEIDAWLRQRLRARDGQPKA